MNAPSERKEKRRAGRPRSERAREAILAAALDLFAELGPGRVTMEAVASRAGVGKPTIYRYWPNATALQMAALLEQKPAAPSERAEASPLAALREQIVRVAESFATRRGRQMTQMLAAAEQDSELAKAFRHQVILRSREEGRALLARAAAGGDIRRDLPTETALDMIYGPLFYRLLVGHAPLDRRFAEELVDLAVIGLRPGAATG